MSTNLSLWSARGAKARRLANPTTVEAVAVPSGTPMLAKIMIAVVFTVLALLYAKGVALMIDAADTPSSYATFLYRSD